MKLSMRKFGLVLVVGTLFFGGRGCWGMSATYQVALDTNGNLTTDVVQVGLVGNIDGTLTVDPGGKIVNNGLIDNTGGAIDCGLITAPTITTPAITFPTITDLCALDTSLFKGKVCIFDPLSIDFKKSISGVIEVSYVAGAAQTLFSILTNAVATTDLFSNVIVDLVFIPFDKQSQFFSFLGFTGIDNTPMSPSLYSGGTDGIAKLGGTNSAAGASAGSAPTSNISAIFDGTSTIDIQMNTNTSVSGTLCFSVKGSVLDVVC